MKIQPSTAVSPDLDWSQVRETIRMLSLAVAQIETVMKDGDDSVGTLTNSFTGIAGEVKFVEKITRQMNAEIFTDLQTTAVEHCQAIDGKMEAAIVAFQFYDRLSQRLSHVVHSLGNLAELVSDQSRLYNPHEWLLLQEQIRSRYTIERDKNMFDALMNGASVQEALENWRDKADESSQSGVDIELF